MKQDQIVIYQTEDGKTQIDVRLENETVWLTQAQMAELFKSSRTNVLEHIQHIYEWKRKQHVGISDRFVKRVNARLIVLL